MRLVNYKLQTQMENLNENSDNKYFKEYLKSILEDPNIPYFQKADYIGLCLQEINSKVEYIANDIKELQAYKKRLQTALTLAKELVADVLIQNGVDRVDGNVISSITLQSESITTKQEIVVLDENAVMTLGYVKFEPDIEAIKVALETPKGKKELKDIVTTITETSTNKAKVKVNAKKKSSSNEAITIELLSNDIDDDSLKDVA
ncbi:siphovirus Gp157 family protein [Aliarcobacter butzleri]|uniref:Siphovirus Gp157 family protein n=6 Tax=Aliarcobacter butzleri TaxID=28197 RepID=A0AAW7PUZ5_9BACT|nr:siphovirus Gp157 family protein [Aliarcobacter butzleri]MCG3669258.1 siphovirus Gp157 family protein [Aliarcobacter butzleri]MCT7549184.1 siphovirus Gp157 family protein [Aliarcobacter butzleri]MCT7558494.1 siphovirus Gp157 family protein [Aliarcobacter butzleri]MCT7576298.1 siphovirus Gp157 family protein [Aliarcobacter butzleri]MCT7649083.1 siphovirus Gp157 family protein [Aliarcobacter butzleri]